MTSCNCQTCFTSGKQIIAADLCSIPGRLRIYISGVNIFIGLEIYLAFAEFTFSE